MNLTENIHCPFCDEIIHPKRIEILLKLNKKITCVNCSTEDKLVAVIAHEGKTERVVQVVSKETATNFNKLEKNKNGEGPGIRKINHHKKYSK